MVKPHWDTEELIENWTLVPQELELVSKKVGGNQIGFALNLKHFQLFARFPEQKSSIPKILISYIANQIQIPESSYSDYDWQGRSAKVYRVEIRRFFNFRVATVRDSAQMSDWLVQEILPDEQRFESLKELVYQRFRELQIEPPTPGRVERLIRSAITQHETRLCARILSQLSLDVRSSIDILLTTEDSETLDETPKPGQLKTSDFAFLKTDPGPVGLDSFLTEIEKLKQIRAVGLPGDLFKGVSVKLIQTYRQRAATETPYHLRQHKDAIRYTLMAAFITQRSQEITDNLIELLVQIIQRIGTRAERRINKELVDDFKQVTGKTHLLFRLAEVALDQPSGVVQQVIYPVVSQQTLRDLVKEYKSTGIAYRQRVHTVIRASFANHYRRMIPQLLAMLEFRSNNDIHRPIVRAIELLKKYALSKARYYDATEDIPIDGVLKSGWKEILLEKDADGGERINRINYEICVLQALRERLSCKEIWVVGASRYRNPDEDLPTDFDRHRQIYYQALTLPEDVETFIGDLQQQMNAGLELGRAIKTIFLCEYLHSEAVRREVNEGLNVVERWNGVNDFIFYGKGGEFASNRLESQELSVLSLHLLQICLVYVNTLMIQSVLSQQHWHKKLTDTDKRAITPLLFGHVNPYGLFKLDMNERIARLKQPSVA